ncbi:hypothetical protein Acr_15g0004200 [Actinidia rufa]|uniref:Uncharacterized protein n=1 Tax=Actinidia rufa TaxID=165716 RepID=A0A7J0FT07_9ERIC|nr:hypothetical protein Acr_15g0004200 [Actinidia rufa]
MGTPENNHLEEELRQHDPGDGYDDPEGVKHRLWKRDAILRVISPNAVGRREGHQQEESNANDEERGPDSFVQMMLLDACFVVEFLRKWDLPELRDEDDPIFRTSWIKIQICRDLMLLENQLPFFVLLELFNMSSEPSSPHPPFIKLAEIPIHQMLLRDDYFSSSSSRSCESSISISSIKHFLDFVHNVHVPATIPNCPNQTSIPNNDGTFVKGPCVMELEEAGVKFQAVKEGEKISVFEVNFEDGVLKIPKFEVSDSTEIFLRNIIAYEQLIGDDHKPKYFTDFTFFLDALINTKEDVNKLCGHQIIINIRGDDDEVAHMFNKLGEGRILEPSSFYYSQVLQKLNEHCQKRWNKARAKLRHDYFNSPWAAVSTIAATFLLTLTLTQTVASLIPLFR